MRFLLVPGFIAASCMTVLCQDFDKYKTLLPQGTIPKDFTEQSATKFAAEVTNLSKEKRSAKKQKKKFVLESTFGIDDFLASGSVLFNDAVSLYLDAVLKEILAPYPELKNKLRIYAVKSSSVNAFTTNDGLIFVNLGLLARLENEAQLAFILSHEVVHYQKKHVINSYVTSIEIDKAKGDYRKLSVSEKGFAKSSYAKELEMEADLGGADIYLKSPYAKDSVDKVFDVLLKSDLPLAWVPFSKQRFEAGSYLFPDSLTNLTTSTVILNEDYDDSKSTHPNIKKRRTSVADKFKSGKKGVTFKVSKEQFTTTKKISRFELCRQFLLEHRYEEALALAISLQKENEKSIYLTETILKSLYGAARKSLTGNFITEDKIWGEAVVLASFIDKQTPYELSVLAIKELYKYYETSPANPGILLMVNDLIGLLSDDNPTLAKSFLRTSSQKPLSELTHPYTQYAFLDFRNTNAFFQLFDKQIAIAEKAKAAKNAFAKGKKKKKVKEKPSIKASKVVVVHPVYKKVDKRKKQKVRHVESEEVLINVNDYIAEAAGKLDMKVDVINPNKISRADISVMQSNSLLNDWIDERMRSRDDQMISPIYDEMLALADKYKTDHFVWMGSVTIKSRKYGKVLATLGGVVVPSMAPWALKHIVSTNGNTLYFALAYNLRSQQVELVDLRYMSINDNRPLLQSNIYYTLFSLKKS